MYIVPARAKLFITTLPWKSVPPLPSAYNNDNSLPLLIPGSSETLTLA